MQTEPGELRITLGGSVDMGSYQYQLDNRPGSIKDVIQKTRMLVYAFDWSTDAIDFGGYIFRREIDRGGPDLQKLCSSHP
jgi:hypothetical protein